MTPSLFGLLVGVDDYRAPIGTPLRGAVADIRRWQTYLSNRFGDAAHLLTLTDAEATRQGVVDGFVRHLAQAGPGDTALFVFSGHGSQEQAPPEFAGADASGKLQNLLCSDTGQVADGALVRPLADKELAVLLHQLGERGAHVVVVLDCCHSGDATRSGLDVARRWVPTPLPGGAASERGGEPNVLLELWGPRPLDAFLAGAIDHDPGRGPVAHVALTACQSTETAREREIDGSWRGLFTTLLLDALEGNPSTDYRSLVETVRSRLVELGVPQRPELTPADAGGPADVGFLGSTIAGADAPFVVTGVDGRWTVNAGSLHGLFRPTAGEVCRLTCVSGAGQACGDVRVVSVEPGTSVVEPVGWQPTDATYRARMSRMPTAWVVFVSSESVDTAAASAYTAVRAEIEAGASTLLRMSPSPAPQRDATDGSFTLRVEFVGESTGRRSCLAVSVDGSADEPTLVPWADGDPDPGVVVRWLDHLARWERLRRLGETGDASASLAAAVELVIVPIVDGAPGDPVPLPTSGEHGLDYVGDRPPRVQLRLRNGSAQALWVALVDLADDRSATVLRQTEQLAAGTELEVDPKGRPWEFALSAASTERGVGRDHLKLLVSEAPFDASPFALGPIGAPTRSGEEPAPAEWSASTTTLVITRS